MVTFLVAGLPYILVSGLGGSEGSVAMSLAYAVYQLLGIALLVGWPIAGLRKWRQRPGLLLAYPHLLIALAGWWCTMLVGTINFPFRL